MIHGVDISSYQGKDWTPGSNDKFVFIKASEGTSYTSPVASAQRATAVKHGLVVGFYHFFWPGNPRGQANYFVERIPGSGSPLLVCDWEPTKGGTASESDRDTFIKEVKRLRPDCKVGLYVNRSMWNSSNKHKPDFIWIAAYGRESGVKETHEFWQYSDHPIDQNWGYFDSAADLARWASGTPKPSSGILGMTKVSKFSTS